MRQSDADRSASFYDRLAARYDAEVTTKPTDLLARRAFVELVTRHVTPGSTLLDFGSGTGLDTQVYADRGFRVLAYDNSAGMMERLVQRCAREIDAGQVTAIADDYPSFPRVLAHWPAPHAVVANFAVLNMIRDLAPLFDAFARHLAPPGWIIVSLVNPVHWRHVATRRWWRGVRQKAGDVPPFYLTEHFTSYLHFIPAVLRAAPQFQLVGRANAGTFVRYEPVQANGERRLWSSSRAGGIRTRLKRAVWETAAFECLGSFVFLVLRRDP